MIRLPPVALLRYAVVTDSSTLARDRTATGSSTTRQLRRHCVRARLSVAEIVAAVIPCEAAELVPHALTSTDFCHHRAFYATF